MYKALHFDRKRGVQSIGSGVRDSAAYVLWSLARTLSPQQVEPFASQLAIHLVSVSLFDREIQIRRAASAAFQESVGRLVSLLLYFAKTTLMSCYCTLGSSAARYRRSAQDRLLHRQSSETSFPRSSSASRRVSRSVLSQCPGTDTTVADTLSIGQRCSSTSSKSVFAITTRRSALSAPRHSSRSCG